MEFNHDCNVEEGPRSRKLREAFILATDKVTESLSTEVIFSSFPDSYREDSDTLRAFRLELIEKLRCSMIKEFENISSNVGVFRKLNLIDHFLRKEVGTSINRREFSEFSGSTELPRDTNLSTHNPEKRTKVSTEQNTNNSLCGNQHDLPLEFLSNLANVRRKVYKANKEHLSELAEELTNVEKSVLSLSTELAKLHSSLTECISYANKKIFDVIPECVTGCEEQ